MSAETTDGYHYTPPKERRYSLPKLLYEVQIERKHMALSREKVDQSEIEKLFRVKKKRLSVRKK